MPHENFTTVLARLLSNARYREDFFAHRETEITKLEISPAEAEALRKLDAQAVEQQAEALILKRLRHVGEILPDTFQLQQQDGQALFTEFANQFWPTSHQRHLQDALRFAEWLLKNGKPIEQAELNRLRYHLAGKRWSIHILTRIAGKRRLGIQFLFRRKMFKEWIVSFGL